MLPTLHGVAYFQSVTETILTWVGFISTTVFLIEYTAMGLFGPDKARLRWWRSHAGRAIIALDIGLWFVFAPITWLLATGRQEVAAVVGLFGGFISLSLKFNWVILFGLTVAVLTPTYRVLCLALLYRKRRAELTRRDEC